MPIVYNINSAPDPVKSNEERDQAFASSGLSDDWRDQFNSTWDAYNPESIEDTFWDKISNFFGARSSADKTRLQLEQARKEQIAQLVGLKREQDYNSEQEKVARMKEAGLNPDLQGLGQASEASEASEPEQRPDFSQLSTGADIAGKFSNALTTALSIFSGVQGLQKQGIQIAKDQIEQALSGPDNAIGLIASLYSKQGFKDYFDDPDSYSAIPRKAYHNIGIRSKRAIKMLDTYVNSVMNTYKGEIGKYKTLGEWLDSKKHYGESSSSWYLTHGADTTDKQIVGALKPFNDTLHDLDVKTANFQRTYYSYLKVDKIAKAQNAAADFKKFSENKKRELYNKLTKNNDLFSLILATSLMGDSSAMSAIGQGVGTVAKFL